MRTGPAAIAWAKGQDDNNVVWPVGYCLKFVRTCFGIPGKYPDATTGWNNAHFKHGNDLQPPPGVPVWWTGGSHNYGHVVISVGGGLCYSTDFVHNGQVNLVKIKDINLVWSSLNYKGWSEDINGVRVYTFANLPAVDLSNVRAAIASNFPLPVAAEQSNLDMLRVEHALQHAQLLAGPKPAQGYSGLDWRKAYAEWQKRTVAGPFDGDPGMQSLSLLGQSSLNQFRVVP